MFTKIENSEVLIKTSFGYKVLPLFVRNSTKQVYAKNGQYYIAILVSKITSNAKISWQEINIPENFEKGHLVYNE
ncbi:hypothetical protein [Yersinia phage fHe-Yen9-03]|nr:hypothetical protein [Yersinia phage fHe-Yen9-03]